MTSYIRKGGYVMRVLVACECSGKVRDAFLGQGHEAMSCDMVDTDAPGPHYTGDVRDVLEDDWDMLVAFPPCTHLASSGARWFKDKIADGRQQEGIDLFMAMINAPIDRIAVENPIGIMSTRYRKPDQIIQPWQYGHGETKATCLWLKGLDKLTPTDIVEGREQRIFNMPPSADRSKKRSETYNGIAVAMAKQWS